MKMLLSSCLGFLTLFAGCAVMGPQVEGNQISAGQARDVGSFTRVRVELPCQVQISPGEIGELHITTDENLLPIIRTEVQGEELVISTTSSFKSSLGIQIRLTAQGLTRIEASSASKIRVQGATAEEFELTASGASNLEWEGGAKRVQVTASGASTTTLRGATQELHSDLSGASRLLGFDVTTANAKVGASGASTAEIHALGSLKVQASGASTVRYTGNPQTTADVSGASTVKAKGN